MMSHQSPGASKMAQFDAKKYAELHAGAGGEKKKKAPKAAQPKQEKKPKKEEKEDEDDEPPKPKESKDPFLAFEKGSWDMDEWKRTYSNTDTATEALPYFWEKLDTKNYSVWQCEYTEDLSDQLTFQVCNLVSGMFQRLDRMRKHAFGSMVVFGKTKDTNAIGGIWFWRGQDLAFTLSPDLQVDYESYKWTKLDPTDAAAKKKINEYFLWEGDFDGKEFNQ